MPYEDRDALKALIRFIGEYQPDEVVQIGDVAAFAPHRGCESTANEVGNVRAAACHVQRHFLEPLREVYSGSVGVIDRRSQPRTRESPHNDAHSMAGAIHRLLDLDTYKITRLPPSYAFATGWIMSQSHLGIHRSQIAGNTALNTAKHMGVSVIMGDTLKLGMISHSVGYDSDVVRTLTGVEAGNLVNGRIAKRRPNTGERHRGFVLVHVSGENVEAQLVPITGRRFTVDGVLISL